MKMPKVKLPALKLPKISSDYYHLLQNLGLAVLLLLGYAFYAWLAGVGTPSPVSEPLAPPLAPPPAVTPDIAEPIDPITDPIVAPIVEPATPPVPSDPAPDDGDRMEPPTPDDSPTVEPCDKCQPAPVHQPVYRRRGIFRWR